MYNKKYDTPHKSKLSNKGSFFIFAKQYNRIFIYYPSKSSTFAPNNFKYMQSIEPNIADLVNGWLKSYQLDYKLEQESLNEEIDKALEDYFSKNGGKGGNRPDAKLLLQDKLNDVVLTPSYVASLLVKLARVDKDSYIWDFATGSAGLLVAAMNEMLNDAKENIHSPEELQRKEAHIKAKQLLGLEVLPSVYMLAILNMIMMGDGSSNIINKDSLTDFDGNYVFGENEKFPADAFVLNPPYSAKGNGMEFVETALNMMHKGYAAIIIQNSAGSGKAKEINQRILERHTLVASIKMPIDLFVGKSSVQTNIYVFRVGEKHQKNEMVKFIDFSCDGYTRTNRRKASNNLKDTNQAKERYAELVKLVRFGKSQLHIFSEKEYYEGTIDPKNGADWNQSAPVDTVPTLADFKKTVADYLAWEVTNLLKKQATPDESLGK